MRCKTLDRDVTWGDCCKCWGEESGGPSHWRCREQNIAEPVPLDHGLQVIMDRTLDKAAAGLDKPQLLAWLRFEMRGSSPPRRKRLRFVYRILVGMASDEYNLLPAIEECWRYARNRELRKEQLELMTGQQLMRHDGFKRVGGAIRQVGWRG